MRTCGKTDPGFQRRSASYDGHVALQATPGKKLKWLVPDGHVALQATPGKKLKWLVPGAFYPPITG